MDSGKYIDFHGENPNEVWNFVKNDKGEYEFKKVFLNQVVGGDTDSVMCRIPPSLTKGMTLDEIVEVGDIAAEYTNLEYPEFLMHAFNVPKSRSDSMLTNREVVSDKCFLVTKKRYAMHVVDDEGKRTSKMKIMGLEVKKSDTSKAVKRFLSKTIDMIIDGCSRSDLIEAKNEFKKEFFTLDIPDIGVPMPATMLKKYEDEYEMSRSMKGFPYHYRAALFYNSLCGPMDRPIYVGEKFYVCNIKHIDSKYIGVPVTLNKMPEFMEEVGIDYEAMWAKADKKVNNYMKSLGWDLESQIKQRAADLFGVGV